MAGGGDSYYINEARRIQDNVQQLLILSSEIGHSGGSVGGDWLQERLAEAKALATETHGILKRFHVTATESTEDYSERGQRRQSHRKLNSRYQAALKSLDDAAKFALKGRNRVSSIDRNGKTVDTSSSDPIPSLYPESAMGGWDSDGVLSQTSSSFHTEVKTRLDRGDSRNRRRGENEEKSSKKLKSNNSTRSYVWNTTYHPLESIPQPYHSDDSIYRVVHPQVDLSNPNSCIVDTTPCMPYHQQILTYPAPKRNPYRSNGYDASSVELRDTATTTATGTLRSASMGSQRDLGFYPVQMVKPEELQARLLTEESRGVLQIEKDVKGIRQLYQEIAWQISNETDDLDAIENQMRTAVDLSSHSVGELRHAQSFLQLNCRLKWYLIMGLTIIGFIGVWIITHFL